MPNAPPAWSHLPNAAHIDRILADLKVRPEVWGAAWDAARDAAWNAARDDAWNTIRDDAWIAVRVAVQDAVQDAARSAVRDAVRGAARSAARDDAQGAARGAVCALVAWDDVGYVIDMSPDACRMLMHTAEGHHKHTAVLLLPAVIALNCHDNLS